MSARTLPEVSVVALSDPTEIVPDQREILHAPTPEQGEMVADTYQIAGSIGGGGMGIVYLAVDVGLGRPVALKLIRSKLLSQQFRELFVEEARAMARVNHPNVVTIYSFGEHAGAPYLAMELVQGESLERLLVEQTERMNLDVALGLLDQACLGLSAIHDAGTVHRDIKPSNLLVDRHHRLRICDLGLATSYRGGSPNREVVGTPGYIAPEIVLARGEATPQSDLYSLACVAYELLAGEQPFHPTNGEEQLVRRIAPPSSVRPELSPAFDGAIMAALVEDPHRRTGSVERFRRALLDARSASLDPSRILIVDDDADQLAALQSALEDEFPAAQIDCAENGDAALALFSRRPPSVVISDLQMPGTDGTALTIALRSRADAQAVPIVLLTASGTPEDWRRLSALGADGFVVKPANVEDLASTMRRTLRERQKLGQG